MARMKLTGKRLAGIKADPSRDQYVWDAGDGAIKGLYLRVKPSGTRSWGFQHTKSGKRVRLILGDASVIALDDARNLARKAITESADGKDHRAERKANKLADARTAKRLLDAYEKDMKARRCSPRHVSNTISTLRRGLAKHEGADIQKLTRQDFVRVIEVVGTEGARKALRQRLTPFLNFAVNEGHLSANPMAGWKMPRVSKADRLERPGRVLTSGEIKAVWTACEDGTTYGDMVRVMLLTGLRIGTVAKLTRSMVDEGRGALVIGGEAMKSGREFAVPLTPELRRILDARPVWLVSDLFFPTRSRQGKAVPVSCSGKMQARILKASGTSSWSAHDLRRTFRSMLSDLGFDQDLCERCIDHARGSLIERYDRATRWPERVIASEAMERQIQKLVAGQESVVLPMRANNG